MTKLWLVKRKDRVGYDEYSSMVVAADTEEEARKTYPSGSSHVFWDETKGTFASTLYERWSDEDWGKVSELSVEYLGASEGDLKGVILASTL